ncbi:transient receptor potential cation channel subfamily M member 2-like isoform X1 [Lissotriton helveticus]
MASGRSRDRNSVESDGQKSENVPLVRKDGSETEELSAENTKKAEYGKTDLPDHRINMDTEGQPQTPEGNQEKHVTEDAPDTSVNLPLKDLGNKRAKIGNWYVSNIKKKECAHFVSRPDRVEVCRCGNDKSQHKYEDSGHTEPTWIREKHIIEMPTDAYGDLTLQGRGINKTAKYLRASDSTPPEVLYDMMRTQWKLKVPNLLISVTGGAENIYMDPRLEKCFSWGRLVEAAQSTGAWIITSGCNVGVAKLVGKAAWIFRYRGRGHHEIVTIGIAPWGALHNRDGLIRKEGGLPAKYHVDVNNQGGHLSLDDNHSHFILVDDGTQGDYWARTPLRTELERFISKQSVEEEADMKIPTVCVVLSGGLNTLDIIHSSVTNNTPCVIVEGSGGVADIIAQGVKMKTSEFTNSEIREKLHRLQDTDEDETITEATVKIQDIMRMSNLLTIFRKDKGSAQDLDVAMALLKASHSMETVNRAYQLKLAVLLNRMDIAKNYIFNSGWSWKPEDLYPALTVALIENKLTFVKLFCDQEVVLGYYVTKKTLTQLYNNIERTSVFHQKLKKIKRKPTKMDQYEKQEGVTFDHIEEALKSLLGKFPNLLDFRPQPQEPQLAINIQSQSAPNSSTLKYPIRDLLIWAVVQNRGELAEILWKLHSDCIAGALACRKILRVLSKEEKEIANVKSMTPLADLFEERASGVFSECFRENEKRAQLLLTRNSPAWGGATCLQLAWNDEKSFMLCEGVQKIMSNIWWGELSENNSLFRLFICLVFFPLICINVITFRDDQHLSSYDYIYKTFYRDDQRLSCFNYLDKKWQRKQWGTLTCLLRLHAFFTAPVVVFCYNAASYIGFLWLFAYVLMMDFQTTPSWREILLYIWIISLVYEEGRQLFYHHGGMKCMNQCRIYIFDFWNQVDVLAISLFTVGVVCRWITASFYAGRVILAVDFIVFCLRLMHIFTVSRFLGPKIIMMKGMTMVKPAVKLPKTGPAARARLPCGRFRAEMVVPRDIFSPEEVGALDFYVQRRLPRTIAAGGRIAGGYTNRQEQRKRWEQVCRALFDISGVQRTYNQVTHRWTDILDRERDLRDLLGVEVPGLGPPRGKRTEKEDAVAPKEEDAGQGGECSFAGPSGTSGGGASSDVVVVIDSEDTSGEEATQVAQEQTVRKQTVVVAGRVGHTKTSKPTRSMQALLARQRRLDATVAQYRRLVELEGEDTQSSTSNGTSASSSVIPRSAGQRSAPAKRSRAGRRHRRAAKAAPHSTLKARLRRAIHRVSDLEAEVRKLKEYQNLLEGLRLDHATLREQYDALALRHDALEAKVNTMHP